MDDERESRADELIDGVTRKLNAHKPTIGRSKHGQVTWRRLSNGKYEIDLKPTL